MLDGDTFRYGDRPIRSRGRSVRCSYCLDPFCHGETVHLVVMPGHEGRNGLRVGPSNRYLCDFCWKALTTAAGV